MDKLTKKQIVASSAGWVAVVLNILPGIGAGYLYQRRWKAYWITSAIVSIWIVIGAVLGQDIDPANDQRIQLVGLIGLLLIAGITAVEAGLTLKRARNNE